MTAARPLVAMLLRHVCAKPGTNRFEWRPDVEQAREFHWLMEAGLGPLLWRTCVDCTIDLPPAWRDSLVSADLTANVLHGNRLDAALEVADVCARSGCSPLLLKGISVSEQLWPQEHFRPMSDIDVLIPADRYAAVEGKLMEGGFRRTDHVAYHHGPALWDPRRQVIVELHTALFPHDTPFAEGTSFSLENTWQLSVESQFHGRTVKRLRPEFQLVYIASSWFKDLMSWQVDPSFLPSLFDAAFLVTKFGGDLDPSVVARCLDNSYARTSLYILLTYLPRFAIQPVPPRVLAEVTSRPLLDNPLGIRAMHWMLDRYLVGGRRWPRGAPMPFPGRYGIRAQFHKRVVDRLKGRR